MNKELEKLLFNPVRLKILSFLFSVENASFKKLIEVSEATKGNISVQIKNLKMQSLLKLEKSSKVITLLLSARLLQKVKHLLKFF